jgi:hypothetical protein
MARLTEFHYQQSLSPKQLGAKMHFQEQARTTTNPMPPQHGQEVMMIDVDWRQPFIDYIHE